MSESFRAALGRRVVSRATAHELGTVAHLLTTVDCHQVATVVIGRGKKAQLVDWVDLSGFGADAVMVGDESALRSPRDDRERRAGAGKLEVLGTRVLTEAGNELGVVDDISFDPSSGTVELLLVGDLHVGADTVLGAGSYAVVITVPPDPV
jgi:uncharacterized protein YrrD